MQQLINKYNVPAPRYTSYPTVPMWDEGAWSVDAWQAAVNASFWANGRELSLYVHLPYCESLCTYCGCHKHITKNHSVEAPYIDSVLREWDMYANFMPGRPILKELHLGGGTPTFFSPEELERLIRGIKASCDKADEATISFEAHPANTTEEHLKVLHTLGSRRLSLGIQDFDAEVQRTIHRLQSEEEVEFITNRAREIGYDSINYDLIYGLPRQSPETIGRTVATVERLRPDRIAYYSYAHVPWMRPAQKSFEHLLPSQEQKLEMYLHGKELLTSAGYEEIGMDHFALPNEELQVAHRQGTLHRNFMGYTTQSTKWALGLGASAIGDAWTAFGQNEKHINRYRELVDAGTLPVIKGHLLTAEDLFIRRQILNIMCTDQTTWEAGAMEQYGKEINWDLLGELQADGLVELGEHSLRVTPLGRQFLRNISMAFDTRLWRKRGMTPNFSQAI